MLNSFFAAAQQIEMTHFGKVVNEKKSDSAENDNQPDDQQTFYKKAPDKAVILSSPINDVFNRIRPYEGNTVYFDYGRGNDLDGNIDVQYSFRFLMSDPKNLEEDEISFESAVTFSGEFDFYAATRDSGPVIGRRYNPGVRFQYVHAQKRGLIALNFSVEHESNGQVIDTLDTIEASKIAFQERYAQNHPNIADSYYYEMASDSVSRSTEVFGAVGGTYRFNLSNVAWNECESDFECFELSVKFRKGAGFEDEVFWDPRMRNAKLKEHQGSLIALRSGWGTEGLFDFLAEKQSLSVVYRTGEVFGGSPGKRNTWDIHYTIEAKIFSYSLPILFSYHHGYLEELSLYSYKNSYWRIGFLLDL